MIAAGYTLDLYCSNTGMHSQWEFPVSFLHSEHGSVCRRQAREAGWKVNYQTRAAYCPNCVRQSLTPKGFKV